MTNSPIARNSGGGYSLIEKMIALTIGMFLLTGLTVIFANSGEANRELQKTAQQIENGRYAAGLVFQDLRHAGFYGHLTKLPAAPASLPDPCISPTAANLTAALGVYMQAYNAPDLATRPDLSAATCAAQGLTSANLKPGSDVVVIRRADTVDVLASTSTAVLNEVYIQATSNRFDIQIGNGAVLGTNKANGAASTLFLSNNIVPSPPAPIRKYHVHIYFVAPCSAGSGAGGVCQNGDDAIPTLKRIELGAVGGATAYRIVPLVEGIEYLRVEYGIQQ
jgi:type IV pilus assembly protein PilW